MPRKRQKTREKLENFADWEIEFLKNGPPKDKDKLMEHPFVYMVDGLPIWRRLKSEPGFDPKDFLGRRAYLEIAINTITRTSIDVKPKRVGTKDGEIGGFIIGKVEGGNFNIPKLGLRKWNKN